MELQFEKKTCQCLQRNLWEIQEQEQTQEIRLADEMPDIGTIVAAWGQCVMRGKEWHSDHVGATGGVMARVLYIGADGNQLQVVECWLPMQMKWNMPLCENEGAVRTVWLLKNVDARMLSARKLMVRANAQVLMEALTPQTVELYQAPQVPEDVQLLQQKYPMLLPVEAGEKAFSADGEVDNGMQPAVETLAGLQLHVQLNEQNVVGGKVVFRGDVVAQGVYLGQDGMLHSFRSALPFSQFSDLDRDYDKNATVAAVCAVTNVETEPVEGKLQLKVGVVVQYLVYEQMMVETVADAYSPWRAVDCRFSQMQLPVELERKNHTEKLELAFDAKPGRIVDAWVRLGQCTQQRDGDGIRVENRGDVQFLFYDESGMLCCDTQRYGVTQHVPVGGHANVLSWTQPGDATVQLTGEHNGVIAQVSATWQTLTVAPEGIGAVCGLELGEKQGLDHARPSLVLQRAQGGSLWELAKKNGSTVDAIMQANALTEEPIIGQMLLIPVV